MEAPLIIIVTVPGKSFEARKGSPGKEIYDILIFLNISEDQKEPGDIKIG
jgi:hypothetical protein